jgi:serine/threonine protein kinase
MALKSAAELQPFILKRVERTGRSLGSGSFGTVEEMFYDHAPCAGKIIHDTLLDSHNIGAAQLITRFEQECKLLKQLRFPYIVQFLGLCFFDDCKSPVIVMELLSSNVDQMISNAAGKELPQPLKFNILCDTAKGLHHLHSHNPQIIHRDLTARNVLLTQSMRAKIADLGNAYIAPPQHIVKTMTRVPGTVPYMPPEAFHPKFPYTEKLDMFSYGHLGLYIMVQEEPYDDLLSPVYSDPSNPKGVIGRTEVERRSVYLDKLHLKLASGHDVSLLIQDCLSNSPESRPAACQVIKVFDDLLKAHYDDYQAYDALKHFEPPSRKVTENKEKVMVSFIVQNVPNILGGF